MRRREFITLLGGAGGRFAKRPSHKPSLATVFDYASALAQGDWRPRPALTCGQVRCLRNLKVLDAGQMLYDVLAVGIPRIDAVSEMGAIVYRHRSFPNLPLPPLHRRARRILRLEPIGTAARAVGRILALRHDALKAHLAGQSRVKPKTKIAIQSTGRLCSQSLMSFSPGS
jgi:hypothetical protein